VDILNMIFSHLESTEYLLNNRRCFLDKSNQVSVTLIRKHSTRNRNYSFKAAAL